MLRKCEGFARANLSQLLHRLLPTFALLQYRKGPPSYENRSFSRRQKPHKKTNKFLRQRQKSLSRCNLDISQEVENCNITAIIISAGIISTISLSRLKYSDYRSWRSCLDWAIEIQHGVFIKSSRWDFCPAQIALRNISLWNYRVCSSR